MYSYSTVIGINCVDGVIVGVEKAITSKLMVPDTNKRIMPLGVYSSLAISGILPDGMLFYSFYRI
jgi:20S proteasome subunit alpha 7